MLLLGVTQADQELFTLPAAQGHCFHPSFPAWGNAGMKAPSRCESSVFFPSCWSMSSSLATTPVLWDQSARKATTGTPQREFSSLHSPHAGSSASLEKTYKVDCQCREKATEVLLELPVCSVHYKYIRKNKLFTISQLSLIFNVSCKSLMKCKLLKQTEGRMTSDLYYQN